LIKPRGKKRKASILSPFQIPNTWKNKPVREEGKEKILSLLPRGREGGGRGKKKKGKETPAQISTLNERKWSKKKKRREKKTLNSPHHGLAEKTFE